MRAGLQRLSVAQFHATLGDQDPLVRKSAGLHPATCVGHPLLPMCFQYAVWGPRHDDVRHTCFHSSPRPWTIAGPNTY